VIEAKKTQKDFKMKTAKLEKIEKRAWTEFNVRGRKFESAIMDSIRDRWENEVQKITGEQEGQIKMKMPASDGGFYYYNFGDVCA